MWLERHSPPEPQQYRVLPVEEGRTAFRRGDGKPRARRHAGAILEPRPIRKGSGPEGTLTASPVRQRH